MTPSSSRTQKHLLAFGDSLTAGFGLPSHSSFSAQLQRRLDVLGHRICVDNHGISGDTTAGGLSRLDSTLRNVPDYVLLELGTNDALMDVPLPRIEHNLERMIQICLDLKCPTLLAGVDLSPLLGHEYGSSMGRVFASLAERYELILHPDFLAGVVGRPELTLMDGVHPSEQGVAAMVEAILGRVVRLISSKPIVQRSQRLR